MYGDWTPAVPNGCFADCSDCWISLFARDIGTQESTQEICVLAVKWKCLLLADGHSELVFQKYLL